MKNLAIAKREGISKKGVGSKDLGNLTKIIETETNPETVKSQNLSKCLK